MTDNEINLLSKGLKFVPTPKSYDRAKLKEELEQFGRKLRLAWVFRNEERTTFNPFKVKSAYNPRNCDAAIEVYLSSLEESLMAIHKSMDEKKGAEGVREVSRVGENSTS